MADTTIFSVPPRQLGNVRRLSHAGVQWASRAARANLPAAADDSHSNLGWDDATFGLLSRPLDADNSHQLGFNFRTFSLVWLAGGAQVDSLALEKSDEAGARAWCDTHLSAVGLQTTDGVEMPYELGPVDYGDFAAQGSATELKALGAWYAQAQAVLDDLVTKFGELAVSPPSVRCWPHHFDLATLFVLEEGDPETARSIGVGLSPGDRSYPEPYFYCTPWPAPSRLPEAPGPMHWHTDGFTSLVCTASVHNESIDLNQLLTDAVQLSRELMETK